MRFRCRWGRKPRGINKDESTRALVEAKHALEEVQGERDDVIRMSTFLQLHRTENHWSQRIDRLLREGR